MAGSFLKGIWPPFPSRFCVTNLAHIPTITEIRGQRGHLASERSRSHSAQQTDSTQQTDGPGNVSGMHTAEPSSDMESGVSEQCPAHS